MRRFERIHDVVEPIEEYRVGGYHPVHLGDIFHERYQIIANGATARLPRKIPKVGLQPFLCEVNIMRLSDLTLCPLGYRKTSP